MFEKLYHLVNANETSSLQCLKCWKYAFSEMHFLYIENTLILSFNSRQMCKKNASSFTDSNPPKNSIAGFSMLHFSIYKYLYMKQKLENLQIKLQSYFSCKLVLKIYNIVVNRYNYIQNVYTSGAEVTNKEMTINELIWQRKKYSEE